jgi:nucleoside-diphosphate-sugar epimerase
MESLPIVTITGISGYVGSQVCLAFLKNGTFKVRGTVRSVSNAAKIEPLKVAFGEHFEKLELVEADLLNEESLFKAI